MSESILQFGAGNFLRAFVDLFVAQANRTPATAVGRIVVVQSTDRQRADALNAAQGRYHVAVRGYADGRIVDEVETVDSISRALHAGSQWAEVRAFARSPGLRWIFSNTTEAGFALDDRDATRSVADVPPHSFPAKLLDVLLVRHAAGQPAVAVAPCELIEQNGKKLRALVLAQADRWQVDAAARAWIADSCRWLDSLVDRIVPGAPAEHPLKASDPLLISAEPYAFWAVEGASDFIVHPAVTLTTDLKPYYLRKVRLLNGGHTLMVLAAYLAGHDTVKQCMDDPLFSAYLRRGLYEEIIPTLDLPADELAAFAKAVEERFANPFVKHALLSISLNSTSKFAVRVLPSLRAHLERKGRLPSALVFSFAALIAFYRGTELRDGALVGRRPSGDAYAIKDSPAVLAFFLAQWSAPGATAQSVTRAVLGNSAWWDNVDLNTLPGLTDAVASALHSILTDGVVPALKRQLA